MVVMLVINTLVGKYYWNTIYEIFKRIKTKLASIDTVLNFFYNILANHYIIFMQYEIKPLLKR
jgi:hypothetical protein